MVSETLFENSIPKSVIKIILPLEVSGASQRMNYSVFLTPPLRPLWSVQVLCASFPNCLRVQSSSKDGYKIQGEGVSALFATSIAATVCK